MIMQDNEKKPALRFKGFTDPWEQRKLAELTKTITTGKSVNSDEGEVSDGNIGVLKTSCVSYDRFNPSESKPVVKSEQQLVKCAVEKDSVIVSRMNTPERVGACGYVSTDFPNLFLPDRLWKLKFQDTVDTYFVYMMLVSSAYKEKITSMASGTSGSMSGIPKETFLNLQLVIPAKIDEQKQLGKILKKIDTLITLHQRKYEKLVNIKKSMLDKMFPKNGASVPEIRFKGFTDPWEQRKLSELTSMHARIGWQNLRTSEFLDSGDYMLITGTDFDDGTVNYSTCHFVERERYEQDKNIQIRNGSILITKDGTLGKVAYVQGLSMPATLNAGVFNVEIRNTSIVDERYLFQYLKAPFLMDYVDKKATGGTIKHLNQNILVDFPVVMPKKTEQVSIGNFFQRIDTLITLHQRKLEKLQNIKKSCLEKMFV